MKVPKLTLARIIQVELMSLRERVQASSEHTDKRKLHSSNFPEGASVETLANRRGRTCFCKILSKRFGEDLSRQKITNGSICEVVVVLIRGGS